MVYMRDGHIWEVHSGKRRGQWEVESVRCHPFAGGFECDCRQSERGTQEGGEAASETMSHQPDVGVRKEEEQVLDQFLNSRCSRACRERELDGNSRRPWSKIGCLGGVRRRDMGRRSVSGNQTNRSSRIPSKKST